jgi:aminopeptidase-like protein
MSVVEQAQSRSDERRSPPQRLAAGGATPLLGADGAECLGDQDITPGAAMYQLVSELYPTCRSITGDGVRATLARLGELVPMTVHEVPSGTAALDWKVPKEWNIRDAYIKDASGRRVVDFHSSNLHVVNYSVPVHRTMTLDELRPKLFTLPQHPDWIPYRTSYYREDWGFCLTQNQLEGLPEGRYEVCIDSTLADGSLTYGEAYLPGETTDEVLISCHVCHPSLCNDNLSGIAVATYLARHLEQLPQRRFSYRFLFIPGTIGALAWLSRNAETVSRVRHGLVLALVGDSGPSTYKQSRRGDAEIDRAFEHVLRHSGTEHTIQQFEPLGYDERQFCSPGFNLPMGCLMRTPHGKYPQYHTSADDLSLVRPESLEDTWTKCVQVIGLLEGNQRYQNLNPCGEPQLGRRGLYSAIGGTQDQGQIEQALLWVLNFSDGRHSLLDIAQRAELPFALVRRAADLLFEHQLLRSVDDLPFPIEPLTS